MLVMKLCTATAALSLILKHHLIPNSVTPTFTNETIETRLMSLFLAKKRCTDKGDKNTNVEMFPSGTARQSTPQVKVLSAEPEFLSSFSRTRMIGGEKKDS